MCKAISFCSYFFWKRFREIGRHLFSLSLTVVVGVADALRSPDIGYIRYAFRPLPASCTVRNRHLAVRRMKSLLCVELPVVLALFLCVACGSIKEQNGGAPAAAETTVDVRNRNWLSMEIYVVGQSQRVRLGRVGTGESETFVIPPHLLSGATPLRFIMEASGPAASILSEEFVVVPGETVVLVIPNE